MRYDLYTSQNFVSYYNSISENCYFGLSYFTYSSFEFVICNCLKIYDVVTVTLLLEPGEGTGEFPVAMMLYKDDTYEEVYNEPPTLNVTDR